jgi:hypothetical protein
MIDARGFHHDMQLMGVHPLAGDPSQERGDTGGRVFNHFGFVLTLIAQ